MLEQRNEVSLKVWIRKGSLLLFSLWSVFGYPAVFGTRADDDSKHVRVVVGPNVLVSADNLGPHYESAIAADASVKDSKRLLGAAFLKLQGGNRMVAKLYSSEDAGSTWMDSIVPIEQYADMSVDVQVAFDRWGIAYFLADIDKFLPAHRDQLKRGIYFLRSEDSGRNWQKETWIAFDDHPQLVIDTTGSKYDGRIYVSALEGIYRSEDGGRSFSGVRPPSPEPGFSGSDSLNPLVFSDGSLFIPRVEWSEAGRNEPTNTQKLGIAFSVSPDGGKSFSELRHILDAVVPTNSSIRDQIKRGVVASPSGFPSFAVDPGTQKLKDQIYLTWSDLRSGHQRVLFTSSKDRGLHWSEIAEVDSNAPADSFQYNPAIAVNENGTIGIQWYDTRDSTDNRDASLYFAASADGGATFSQGVRVSTTASYPYSPGNLAVFDCHPGDSFVNCYFTAARFPDGGDYMGLTADPAGVFHPFWLDGRLDSYQIYTARVEVLKAVTQKPSSPPKVTRADITKLVTLRYDPIQYDAEKKEISLPIRLYNRSEQTIYPPIQVEITSKPLLTIQNADNGKTGAGAVFAYDQTLGGLRALGPGDISEPIRWRFLYTDWGMLQLLFEVKVTANVPE